MFRHAGLFACVMLLPCWLLGAERPERLAVVSIAVDSVSLTWDAAAAAASLVLERSRDAGVWETRMTLAGTATATTDTGLAGDQTWLYRLHVRDAGGQSLGRSNCAVVTPLVAMSALAMPGRVHALRQPDRRATVRWEHRLSGHEGWQVERSLDGGGSWQSLGTVGPAATAWVDPAPPSAVAVQYRVRATAGATTGPWVAAPAMVSLPGSVSSWSSSLGYTVTTTAFTTSTPAPIGLAIERLSGISIHPTWTGGSASLLRAWDAQDAEDALFAGTTVALGDQAWLRPQRLVVVNAGGFSNVVDLPAQVIDQTLEPPSLTATYVNGGANVALTWNHPGPVTAFVIEKGYSDTFSHVIRVDGTVTAFQDVANYLKAYRIQAVGPQGASVYSKVIDLTPASPVQASNLRITGNASDAIDLAWDGPGGYPGYVLARATGAGAFDELATIDSGTTFRDVTVRPGTTYRYQVFSRAAPGQVLTVQVISAQTTAVPAALASLSASGVAPGQINLAWTPGGGAPAATWLIRVATADGGPWTDLAEIPVDCLAYSQTSLAAGQGRWYQVAGRNASGLGAFSSATAVTPASAPAPTIEIRTASIGGARVLVVTGTTANDSLLLSANGATIAVRDHGALVDSVTGPFEEILLLGNAGDDRLEVDASVAVRCTIIGSTGSSVLIANGTGPQAVVAFGHGRDQCSGRDGRVVYWVDDASIDQVTASAADRAAHRVHHVLRFHGDVTTRRLGQDLPEPGFYDSYPKVRYPGNPFWGAGPGVLDVQQGYTQSCQTMSVIQGLAWAAPEMLQRLAVDLGDGTFAVAIEGGYARVDGDFSPLYMSELPASGRRWAMVLEKVWHAGGLWRPTWAIPTRGENRQQLWELDQGERAYRQFRTALDAGRIVTVFSRGVVEFDRGHPRGHAHSVLDVARAADGSPRFLVRNPYGVQFEMNSGAPDPANGLHVLTYPQLVTVFEPPIIRTPSEAPVVPPVAIGQSLTVAAGSSVRFRLDGGDADNLPLQFAVVGAPARGVLTGTAPWLTYAPGGTVAGSETCTFRVSTANGTSALASVAITITGSAVNAPPIITMPATATSPLVW